MGNGRARDLADQGVCMRACDERKEIADTRVASHSGLGVMIMDHPVELHLCG
jgi:hypothetical protein